MGCSILTPCPPTPPGKAVAVTKSIRRCLEPICHPWGQPPQKWEVSRGQDLTETSPPQPQGAGGSSKPCRPRWSHYLSVNIFAEAGRQPLCPQDQVAVMTQGGPEQVVFFICFILAAVNQHHDVPLERESRVVLSPSDPSRTHLALCTPYIHGGVCNLL